MSNIIEQKEKVKPNGSGCFRMHLTILPRRLWLVSLKKSFLPSCSFPLMQLLLFQDKERFFSLTETEDEISLILGEDTLKLFSSTPNIQDNWEVCGHPWIAIQVSEGSLGFTSMGVIHALSDPLAKAGISIFNLSTAETDYTLVPEDRIFDAIDCLEEVFSILIEGLDDLLQILPRPEKRFGGKNEEKTFKQHPLSLPPDELYLCYFRKDEATSISMALLKMLFFPKNKSRFLSYTESEDEISLVLDKDSISYFEGVPNTSGPWRLIKVDDGPLGFSETGIVCSLAEALIDFSLFYVSTYFTDYVLVEAIDIEKVINILKQENFTFKE